MLMSFGHALECLDRGETVSRVAWQGAEKAYLALAPGASLSAHSAEAKDKLVQGLITGSADYSDTIEMAKADGTRAPWEFSQSDAAACDWQIACDH